MRKLPEFIKAVEPSAFVMSYADDSYIAVSCDRLNYANACVSMNSIFSTHKKWLKDLGMVCNSSKTEYTVFGSKDPELNIVLDGQMFKPLEAIKILGVMFDRQLKWDNHVAKVIRKCSAMSYSLRLLNNILPRQMHRQVIFSHFISHDMYASPIWDGCISVNNRKTLRLHCFDFQRSKSNLELCTDTNIRFFKSLRLIYYAKMLFRLATQCDKLNLTSRLTSQSVFFLRFPGHIAFTDLSKKKNRMEQLHK